MCQTAPQLPVCWLAWLDNESNVAREDVVEMVMFIFEAVADRFGDATIRT